MRRWIPHIPAIGGGATPTVIALTHAEAFGNAPGTTSAVDTTGSKALISC